MYVFMCMFVLSEYYYYYYVYGDDIFVIYIFKSDSFLLIYLSKI